MLPGPLLGTSGRWSLLVVALSTPHAHTAAMCSYLHVLTQTRLALLNHDMWAPELRENRFLLLEPPICGHLFQQPQDQSRA